MSRRIHTTRSDLEQAHRWEYSNPDDKPKAVCNLNNEIARKRRIKRKVSIERSVGAQALPPTDLNSNPIIMCDKSTFVHYPASPDDIRAAMQLLPRGVLDGLCKIELSLGFDVQNADYGEKTDPHTGRIGCEVLANGR